MRILGRDVPGQGNAAVIKSGPGTGLSGYSRSSRGLQVFAPFLLHGVTASGKTEVYLQAAQEALTLGKGVLVLLPEIALTNPVGQAFRQRFGPRVALLHSGLSPGARLDQWRRLAQGEMDMVVGARSALFAPVANLGLIVVDEEHDPAYKNEGGLPYQARDAALYPGTTGPGHGGVGFGHPVSDHFLPGRAAEISLPEHAPTGHPPDLAPDSSGKPPRAPGRPPPAHYLYAFAFGPG